MSDLPYTDEPPYTDEQVAAFARAWFVPTKDPDTRLEDYRHVGRQLRRLDRAGIKVVFPEPRFRVKTNQIASYVYPARGFGWVAAFDGPRHEEYAQEHADRLNAHEMAQP